MANNTIEQQLNLDYKLEQKEEQQEQLNDTLTNINGHSTNNTNDCDIKSALLLENTNIAETLPTVVVSSDDINQSQVQATQSVKEYQGNASISQALPVNISNAITDVNFNTVNNDSSSNDCNYIANNSNNTNNQTITISMSKKYNNGNNNNDDDDDDGCDYDDGDDEQMAELQQPTMASTTNVKMLSKKRPRIATIAPTNKPTLIRDVQFDGPSIKINKLTSEMKDIHDELANDCHIDSDSGFISATNTHTMSSSSDTNNTISSPSYSPTESLSMTSLMSSSSSLTSSSPPPQPQLQSSIPPSQQLVATAATAIATATAPAVGVTSIQEMTTALPQMQMLQQPTIQPNMQQNVEQMIQNQLLQLLKLQQQQQQLQQQQQQQLQQQLQQQPQLPLLPNNIGQNLIMSPLNTNINNMIETNNNNINNYNNNNNNNNTLAQENPTTCVIKPRPIADIIANNDQPSKMIQKQQPISLPKSTTSTTPPPTTTTTTTATGNKGLPIDKETIIYDMEKDFLKEHQIQEYTYDVEDDNASTVIYSRILDTHYVWPIDRPLTIKDLRVFEKTGHTLSIDYTKTYCRPFALDLDCLCRRKTNITTHLNEQLVVQIQNDVINAFVSTLNVKASTLKFSLWRNRCGFHLYTNMIISLPTHLYLKHIIEVNSADKPVFFEVPTFMPLPFSAKNINMPYRQMNRDHSLEIMPLTMSEPKKYLELFNVHNVSVKGCTYAKIDTMSGELYLVKLPKSSFSFSIPKIVNVKSITIDTEHSFIKQYESYIIHLIREFENVTNDNVDDFNMNAYNDNVRESLRSFMIEFNQMFAGGNGNNNRNINNNDDGMNVDGEFNNNDNNNTRQIMANTSSMSSNLNPANCQNFITISAINNGGLYLQSYVACLYMHMREVVDFKEFRQLLMDLYSNVMLQYKSVKRFVDLIVEEILYAYDCKDSLAHLHYLYKYNINPTDSIDEQINTILSCNLHTATADDYREMIKTKKANEQMDLIRRVLDEFALICQEYHLIMHNQEAERYFILSSLDNAHYEPRKKVHVKYFPAVLLRWVGDSTNAVNALKNLCTSPISLTTKFRPFVSCPFLSSTCFGTFNVVAGLYTANTRLLVFDKYRKVAIWSPNLCSERMQFNQNEVLLETLDIVHKYTEIMLENIIELYTHAIVAPALIQMRQIISIEECRMRQLVRIFENHSHFECMFFLVEYFPIDPKIIYLMVHLCNEYDGIALLYSYKTLCSRVFNFNDATIETWRSRFNNILDAANYDATLPTYMEQLMSLNGPHIQDVDESTYLFLVILTACITKCPSFSIFVKAFDIKIPPILHKHPRYEDFDYSTSLKAMTTHFERARSIVFGDNLSRFENSLIDECISICMSTNFIPETITNYLAVIGLSFFPVNIKKKMIIFHGAGDVGKSLICNKLHNLVGPQVGRFNDLQPVIKRTAIANFALTIVAELKELCPSMIKSITGNDPESVQQYYSQKYNLRVTQSLMYGATNIHLSFTTNGSDVDRTTINRLYAVLLTGRQVPASTNQANLLSMMAEGCYFNGILNAHMPEATAALGWLSYSTYLKNRDDNNHPSLNTSSQAYKSYQNTVYYNNSRLYKFLVNAGLIDEPGFYISIERFIEIVKQNLDPSDRNSFKSISAFKQQFGQHHDLTKGVVADIQEVGFIQHIFTNMSVMPAIGNIIRKEDIDQHLKIYTLTEHVDNAYQYFQRTNVDHYDSTNECYRDIMFCCSGESYTDSLLLNYDNMARVSEFSTTNEQIPMITSNSTVITNNT